MPLTSGRPLEIWNVQTIDDARGRAEAAAGKSAIVDARVDLGRRMSSLETDALFGLEGVTVASVRDAFAHPEAPSFARPEDAPEIAVDELFRELWRRRFGDDADSYVQERVAGALSFKAVALRDVGRVEDQIAVLDKLIERCREASEPELRYQLAAALYSKAIALDRLSKAGDALAAYDALIAAFSEDDRPAFIEEDVPAVDVLIARARSRRDYLARN